MSMGWTVFIGEQNATSGNNEKVQHEEVLLKNKDKIIYCHADSCLESLWILPLWIQDVL